MSDLVIVESPAKATTIKGYLGSGYKVIASKGHIRDLPKSSLGIDVENGFAPHYINIRGKSDVIKQLKKEAKSAHRVYLATDPDREGEAISWHIAWELGIPPENACRVTFNEITKSAVKAAIKNPRPINEDLVSSQQARRILDRLVGFQLSQTLWKHVKSGLSGGRVQTVAARIITEREEEIRNFVSQEYWTIDADLNASDGKAVTVRLSSNAQGKIRIDNEDETNAICDALKKGEFRVLSVKHSEKQKMPAPPFTTSTLQQEGSKKLGFQSQKVMKVAQELYDGLDLGEQFGGVQGLITYMRTDSLRISVDAQNAALKYIEAEYGKDMLPETPHVYRSNQNAQDAHEAIRPSDVSLTPKKVRKLLSSDQYRLYKLIWERFLASQMAPAVLDTVAIEVGNGDYVFRAGGYMTRFRGFMTLFDYTENENETQEEEQNLSTFPTLSVGEHLGVAAIRPSQHFTEPPPRYTEASLIKFMEENGIGRPSTYAPIISIILNRNYVRRDGKSLAATPLGELTVGYIREHFPEIASYEFTAQMEEKLDSIAGQENTVEGVLADFYKNFSEELKTLEASDEKVDLAPAMEVSDVTCELCGAKMVYKNGRFGRFLACPNFPKCRNTVTIGKDGNPVVETPDQVELAGFRCERCGAEMIVREGKFGTFYACSNYPQCTFTKQKIVDIGVACPTCGAKILARHGKGRMQFYSCENYPDCSFSSWDLPLAEKCPLCGDMLFYRKNRKSVICKNKVCGYKREEELSVDDGGKPNDGQNG